MELNWTTFALEIVNFLVLVWILKRFLYKPVLAAIAHRKAAIDQTLSDAKARQTEAQTLEQQYRNRLADWANEKEKLHSAVLEEHAAVRAQLMTSLEDSLEEERQKTRVLEDRRLNEFRNRAEQESISCGVQFTARLLERSASSELEAKLVDLVLEDLPRLPDEQLKAIRTACREDGCRIKVITAFSLPEQRRDDVIQTLRAAAQNSTPVEFDQDKGLLAGLRISLGSSMVRANLQDELEFFADALRHDHRKQ